MRRRAFLLLCLFVFAAAEAIAADPSAEVARIKRAVKKGADGFYTVKYAKYVIKTDIDAQFAAEAAAYMRKFRQAFRSFFKVAPKLKATPTVYFFKDRETYQAFVKARGHENLANAGGAYVGSRRKSQLLCYHKRPGTGFAGMGKETIRHEGAHQLLSYILGTHRIPVWYNEGVATFFESWNVGESRERNIERLRSRHTRFGLIRRTFGKEEFRDLHHIMRLTHETWVPDDFGKVTKQHYAEVQSFMTFLLVEPRGRKFFTVIFRAVAARKDTSKMLKRKLIDSAQAAWYKDVEERIAGRKKPKPKT